MTHVAKLAGAKESGCWFWTDALHSTAVVERDGPDWEDVFLFSSFFFSLLH